MKSRRGFNQSSLNMYVYKTTALKCFALCQGRKYESEYLIMHGLRDGYVAQLSFWWIKDRVL